MLRYGKQVHINIRKMKLFYYIRRIEEDIFKRLYVVRFCRNSVGLKNTNASDLLVSYIMHRGDMLKIEPSQLFLGPDFLKDKYTLLGRCITDSPHIGFVSALMNNEPIEDTEYIQRFLNGTLDWRSPTIMPKDKMCFYNKFEHSLSEIQSGEYTPVTVYLQGGKYYIYDGKHRAALCALLGKGVRCKVVGNEVANANVWNYMFQMIEGKAEFQRHVDFHKTFLTEYDKKS